MTEPDVITSTLTAPPGYVFLDAYPTHDGQVRVVYRRNTYNPNPFARSLQKDQS